MKKIALGLLAASLVYLGSAKTAEAQDPFAFQFGYTLGYQNSFRYRVPTPPYFAVHPPVYYGKRYARPYGESPFASWPLLQPNPTYMPMPTAAHSAVSIANPHCEQHIPTIHVGGGEPMVDKPATTATKTSEAIVIINPYALEQYAKSTDK
ncbi:MAG: hypothetical protein MUC43_01495 [Pirellula sp.]|nr:hypothetical protein [Pirellula sp.]